MDKDFLLINKMKNGDESAMESFVCRYYPKILCYCHYHVADRGYAEDITQETFVKFFWIIVRLPAPWKSAELPLYDCR